MVEVRYSGENGGNGLISRLLERDRSESIGRFLKPSIAQLEYYDGKGIRLLVNAYFTPLEAHTQNVHLGIYTRRGLLPGFIKRLVLAPLFGRVLAQDRRILRQQACNIECFGEAPYISTELDLIGPHIVKMLSGDAVTPSEKQVKLEL